MPRYQDKLQEFRESVLPASSALILMHDYPDPDSLASACGVSELLAFWGVGHTVIAYGGFVGRAENRAMVRFLNIKAVPFALVHIGDFDRIIIVDCYPGRGNVSLPPGMPVHAVIDHHPSDPPPDAAFFHDIRGEYGATATIITSYLLQAGCRIPPKLATALFNGIKTDTDGTLRDATPDDVECYKRLFDIMDHRLLSQIEAPKRDAEFFRLIHTATESATCHKNVGYVHLGAVTAPDSIAEMAELFHSWEKVEWIVCAGIFNNQIFYSIRSDTSNLAGAHAERIAERFGGNGGGHAKAAAGKLPITGDAQTMADKVKLAVIEIFGVADEEPERLL
ncbi:MAG: DHH family phosphoesterase [Chitinispirillales bacterium]|nr:DHH family phosphoesterase [Chitinispirillales bacterium]